MKKLFISGGLLLINNNKYLHLFRITRLTTYLLLVFSCFVFAENANSQKRVSLNKQQTALKDVLNEIEQQTDYLFISNRAISLEQIVSIQAKNKPVREVLDKLFENSNLAYTLEGLNIIITQKASVISDIKQQEKRNFSGIVLDENGIPIIGANVMEKGNPANGASTDLSGKFTLNIPDNAVLTVSYIGYQIQEVKTTNKTSVSIQLTENSKLLDEVVVIGYGTSSVRKLTSAVTTVKAQDISKTPFSNITQALQGRGAGIIVNTSGGEPGSIPQLSIRGGGEPLYVINGVIRDQFTFANLNPEDIESISFLKDAASTAVYGARAGDGIVLVTTKRGKKGISVEYSFMQQYSQPTKLPERVNSLEYANAYNQAADYDQATRIYSDEVLQKIKDQSDPYNYANTNWNKVALKNFAPEQRHNLAINGGGDKTNYYVGFGYFDQGSLYKANTLNMKRYNVRTNVNTIFKEIGLNLNLDLNATLQERKYPSIGMGTLWGHLDGCSPLKNPFNPDGTYQALQAHVLAELDKRAGYDKYRKKFIDLQFSGNWDIPVLKGVSVGVLANYTEDDDFQKIWRNRAPQYTSDGELFIDGDMKPSLNINSGWNRNIYLEGNIGYKQVFNKVHTIETKFIAMKTTQYGEKVGASRRDYISGQIDQIFAGPEGGKNNSGNASEGASMGYVGRIKYDYAAKYIIEGNFRYDGSDNFAPDNRWGFFPSGSIAWIASEESFMEYFKDRNIIDLLKARVSIGQTGLMAGVDRFGYLFTYNLDPNAYVFAGDLVSGFSEGALVNPEAMSWYEQNSYNFGFDFSTLKNRLTASFDYFYIRTTGYLMNPKSEYSTPLGKDLPKINSNSAHRRAGFEFNIQYKDNVGKLNYNIGMNLTKYDQLWERLATEDSVTLKNPLTRTTHQKDNLGRIYFDSGLYQNADQILNNPRFMASTATKPGDVAYKDINGDGKIDDQDRVKYGKPSFPHFTYGINFSADYKGWFMSGLLQGTGNRYVSITNDKYLNVYASVLHKYQLDYWRPDNTDARYPRHSTDWNVNGGNNKQVSTFNTWNTRYIRLKSLNIGYDLKYALLKDVKQIGSLKISLSGTNLFTISDVYKFVDPEDSSFSGAYPVQRVYALNVSVGF